MSQSGVARLLEQEKKAENQKLEAKKARAEKIKKAREAANREIADERARIMKEIDAMEAAQANPQDAVASNVEKEKQITALRKVYDANKDLVVKTLFDIVTTFN